MAARSSIEWTDMTWNPVTGCTKVSAGCKNCLSPDTRILMADLSWMPIRNIRVGDQVVSFTEAPRTGQNRTYSLGTVEDVWETTKPAVQIKCAGRTIIASEDHPFLTYTRPQWKKAGTLQLSSGIIGIGAPSSSADVGSREFLAGYAAGAIEGDGTFRWQRGQRSDKKGFPQAYCRVAVQEVDKPILDRTALAYAAHGVNVPGIRSFDGGRRQRRPMLALETRSLASLEAIHEKILSHQNSPQYRMGWLAGFFDTDGCYSGKNLSFSQKEVRPLLVAQQYARDLGFDLQVKDSQGGAMHTGILVGSLEERIRFLSVIHPALQRKCVDFLGRRFPRTWESVDGVMRIGPQRLIDVQVDTRTFIAEGFASHNCYAERMALRLQAMGQARYARGFELSLHWDLVRLPYSWSKPRRVFINSMSDLFHPEVPDEFIRAVFTTMSECPSHQFQVLTKRSERLKELGPSLPWTLNIWVGVSVENREVMGRINDLREVPAAVRFLSCEPLIAPLEDLDLTGIDWVIVGGESGPRSRTMAGAWVDSILRQCRANDVPFFFKQWGGFHKSRRGRMLNGVTFDEMPTPRLRQESCASEAS